jgi:hypothetical protein
MEARHRRTIQLTTVDGQEVQLVMSDLGGVELVEEQPVEYSLYLLMKNALIGFSIGATITLLRQIITDAQGSSINSSITLQNAIAGAGLGAGCYTFFNLGRQLARCCQSAETKVFEEEFITSFEHVNRR